MVARVQVRERIRVLKEGDDVCSKNLHVFNS
jgi:hypothetical protein